MQDQDARKCTSQTEDFGTNCVGEGKKQTLE